MLYKGCFAALPWADYSNNLPAFQEMFAFLAGLKLLRFNDCSEERTAV